MAGHFRALDDEEERCFEWIYISGINDVSILFIYALR